MAILYFIIGGKTEFWSNRTTPQNVGDYSLLSLTECVWFVPGTVAA